MTEGLSAADVRVGDQTVLRTFDELADFLRASSEAPENAESDIETDGEVLE